MRWTCINPQPGERNLRHRTTGTMKILPIVVLFTMVACLGSAQAQDDGESRAAPSRGLLKRGLVKGKPTTTTTTAAPQEEAEYDDEADYGAEDQQDPSTEAPASSTEGKKLVAGGVRPFRSNTDLLETLKRRRAQAAEAKLHGNSNVAQQTQESATEAPVKANFNKKRFNSAPLPARESANEDSPPSSKPSRGRFGKPSTRAIQEAEPEEQNDAAPPTRSGRGFPRRGVN